VVPVHVKKAYRENGDIAPLILYLALDGVNRQLHTKAALLLRKNPVPIACETGWVPELVWMFWRKKYLASLLRFKLYIIQPIA
jgi:hypothetical protein